LVPSGFTTDLELSGGDAVCLRHAMVVGTKLVIRERHVQAARIGKKIIWHEGDALESMRKAKGKYDIIFCYVDKEQYPAALKIAWPKLRKGGIMVTDNALWSARVVTEKPPKPATAGILKSTAWSTHCRTRCICSHCRMVLMLAVKK
jgi:hypothetical protein